MGLPSNKVVQVISPVCVDNPGKSDCLSEFSTTVDHVVADQGQSHCRNPAPIVVKSKELETNYSVECLAVKASIVDSVI